MADDGINTGYYASRPTVRLDGTLQPMLADPLLQSVMVEETTRGLFRCEATFLNWGPVDGTVGFLFFDRKVLDFGKTLSIELAAPGEVRPVFAGRITGIEAVYPPSRPPEITVLAEDRFQDLRMERRTRSFEDVTDADVIRRVAGGHGLTARVDVDGPKYATLAQVNQSDLAFLRERVAAVDAELWIDDRTLYAQARTRRSAGKLTFTYGTNLLEFTVLADLAHQRTSVRVSGWDVAGKQAIDVEAGESAVAAELQGGTSGATVLGRALAPRKERVVTDVPLSSDEAKSLAEARFRSRARRFLRAAGVVDGSARIRVGSTLDLGGLGPFFDGPYYVTLARHTFDLRDGYRTTFEAERPGIGP
jgi:phage protein D